MRRSQPIGAIAGLLILGSFAAAAAAAPAVEVEVIRGTREALPDYVATVDRLVAEGDQLAAGWRIAGTHTGPHPQIPLPPTNRPVECSGCTILEIRDGQVIGALNNVPGLAAPVWSR